MTVKALFRFAVSSIALAALTGCVDTQSAGPGPVATTGSLSFAPSAPASRPADGPAWTGTSGASGHPDMNADAIRAAAAAFPGCVAGLWPQAARRGVSRAVFDQHTAGLSPDLRIMDLMDSQPEFSKPVWDYVDTLVTDTRIQRGREMLAAHRATFDAAERSFGVDRHVIAAIWGIESNYGTRIGDRSVIRSTATLACVGRRQSYFREEFLATLDILQRGDLRAADMRGSWAGAFGPTQFMPTVYRQHALDFDGDGRRDLVNSTADMIASTANFLKKSGWKPGQTWGYEVVVPKGFNYMLADRTKEQTIAQLERLGVRRVGNRSFPNRGEHGYLMVPAGARGPSFLMLPNFRAILRYNPAEAYALAIGHLSDRLRGGQPFIQPWPRDEQVLSRSERLEMQQLLARQGFDVGEPDGRLGGKTRIAVRSFQASAGLVPDGFASGSVLAKLRGR
jgi:lytic murein transglycosylase